MRKLIATLAVTALMPVAAMAAGDAAAGKAKSAVCAGCHGANGISMVPQYPNLAGQKAPYIESAIKAYRSQERAGGNAVMMYGMVGGLSDQDIADLAAYYSGL